MPEIFAIVPIEVTADRRLTLWHIRVLIGLLSFRAKNTDTVWPSRKALAERCCGMHLSNISRVTTELCDLGWLSKEGTGGKSRATRYKITVPMIQTVAESTTVANSATVAESTTQNGRTVAESTTSTVAESARGIEQTIEQTSKSNRPEDTRAHEKFAMHIHWKPSEEFPSLAKMAMVSIPDGKLGEFIAYWLTQPRTQRTQAEWDKAMLQSAMHDRNHATASPATRVKSLRADNFSEKDYGSGITAL
jgi:hypothetical protein